MQSKQHSVKGPSSAHRHLACLGSLAMEQYVASTGPSPDDGDTTARDQGTAAHHLAQVCGQDGTPAAKYKGDVIVLWEHPESDCEGVSFLSELDPFGLGEIDASYVIKGQFEVDDEMVECIQAYLDYCKNLVGETGAQMWEKQAPISHVTGEDGGFGTSDFIGLRYDGDGFELCVVDLKYGQGDRIDAKENHQLMLYASGALKEIGGKGIKNVRVAIFQPRVSKAPSEWDFSVEKLREFEKWAKERYKVVDEACSTVQSWAGTEHQDHYLNPGVAQCKYCKAKANCPKLAAFVGETIMGDFDVLLSPEPPPESKYNWTPNDPNMLASYYLKLPLIEMWCKAVAEKAYAEALAGNLGPEHGVKVVAGKKGARKWEDAEAAEKRVSAMRLPKDSAYNRVFKSPAQIEELTKGDEPLIGQRQWEALKKMITQGEGGPKLVHVSDKRPAIEIKRTTADDFDNLTEAPAPEADISEFL